MWCNAGYNQRLCLAKEQISLNSRQFHQLLRLREDVFVPRPKLGVLQKRLACVIFQIK